ncbi:MAG: response regulator [Flavitalea sp.]
MTDFLLKETLGIFLVAAFWLTTWFQLTVIGVVAVAAVIYHKLMTRKLSNSRLILSSKLHERDELLLYARENEKKIKEEIVAVERSTSELLVKLSHEIRTPMNGVIGMATMLSGTNLTSEQLQYLNSITSCSESLINSINDILREYAGRDGGIHETVREKAAQHQAALIHSNAGLLKLSEAFSKNYPMKILVGEDNLMNQELITMILKRLGYEVEIAQNGKEVLEIVSEKNYDLIFMDVQMPEMDGLEATRMIRLCLSIQPVIIAMTANAMLGDKEECIRSGMDDYISKPLNIEELVVMLERWAVHVKEKAL